MTVLDLYEGSRCLTTHAEIMSSVYFDGPEIPLLNEGLVFMFVLGL